MKVYAFDVDKTLWLSNGPVQRDSLVQLRDEGNILGLCGNWARVTTGDAHWHRLFSFVGPIGVSKPDHLKQIKRYVLAYDYVFVGNDIAEGISPNDAPLAAEAGWRFI